MHGAGGGGAALDRRDLAPGGQRRALETDPQKGNISANGHLPEFWGLLPSRSSMPSSVS